MRRVVVAGSRCREGWAGVHTIFLGVAVVLLAVVPGLIVGALARLPWHLALGFAVPITYGMVAVGSYATGALAFPWNLASAAVTVVIFAGLAVLYSWLLGSWRLEAGRPVRREAAATAADPMSADPARSGPSRLPSWPWLAAPAAGVLVGFGTILYVLVDNMRRTPGGLDGRAGDRGLPEPALGGHALHGDRAGRRVALRPHAR